MNRLLRLATVAVATISPALGAWAYGVVPLEGPINLEDTPAGLSSVEITGNFSINRLAPGYVTLSRDGEAIRQIPASNKQYMYTFSGFDRTETGDVHITFFVDGKANTGGSYTMTVPEGFFTDLATGEPTGAMEFNWTINQTGVTISPARNGSYTSLSEFRITLPETVNSEPVASYRVSGTPTIESLFEDEAPIADLTITTVVEGHEAVITLSEPITTPGTYILNLPSSLIRAIGSSGSTLWTSPSDEVAYRVVPDSKEGITILPEPGEYEEFASLTGEVDGAEFNYTFLIEVPEDTPITYALRAKAQLYPMNEDGSFDVSSSAPTAGSFTAIKKSSTLLALVPVSGATQVVSPAAGRYVLYIPEAMYQTSEGRNGSYWFEYTVLPNTSMPCTITPENGNLTELQDITLTFAPDMEVVCQKSAYATLTNGVAIYTLSGNVSEEQPNVVVFSLPLPLDEKGTWTFTTPSTGFSVGGRAYSTQHSFVIGELVKVDTISAFDGSCDIYTLDGVRVAVKVENTSSLPKGVYIAVPTDGSAARKVLVK